MSSLDVSVLIDQFLGSLQQNPEHPGIRFKSSKCGSYWKHFNASDAKESIPVQSCRHSWKQNGSIIEICYHDILEMAASLSTSLIPYLEDGEHWVVKDASPVIAVSIPEGPYLPISVLAVHLLTVSLPSEIAPILLPMDPEEGQDRLKHMLIDAQPLLILMIDGEDTDRLQPIIEDVFQAEIECKLRILNVKSILRSHESTASSQHLCQFQSTNRPSHLVYTSGTTGRPKGCQSSLFALCTYLTCKNQSHAITASSSVFLASALPFDPCFSDILATFWAHAVLCISSRSDVRSNLKGELETLECTHVLCTPSLWNTLGSTNRTDERLNKLQVVALGGEPIPQRTRIRWARNNNGDEGVRLFATYGVTEACVYQTMGEIFNYEPTAEPSGEAEVEKAHGQDVGQPFNGTYIRICDERYRDGILTNVEGNGAGEVVLLGMQLDEWSGYLNLGDTTRAKFVREKMDGCSTGTSNTTYYRTGDKGYIHPDSGHLYIHGRIDGEEGMIKMNGVRVELGEIEHAILDVVHTVDENPFVLECVVTVSKLSDELSNKLVAYCVISPTSLNEMSFNPSFTGGHICSPSPLLVALRQRCKQRVRKGCTPSTFVLLERMPLTPTGKCNRKALPLIEDCAPMSNLNSSGCIEKGTSLSNYGYSGPSVMEEIINCINLQPCQWSMVTTNASFAILGGDSLAATRVTRALYAKHHNIFNSRRLGGEFGALDGPFNVSHLLSAPNLKNYVDFLDSHGIFHDKQGDNELIFDHAKMNTNGSSKNGTIDENLTLYESLIEAITLGQSTVALDLLTNGADPSYGDHSGRLGKTKERIEQRQQFRSNPLHLACVRGNVRVVKELVTLGCKCMNPDASGMFPIHLACSGIGHGSASSNNSEIEKDRSSLSFEDIQRLICVRTLLDQGKVPLGIKNSSKQTVIHCAARGGFCKLLLFLMERWACDQNIRAVASWGTKFDFQDRWFRTAVHWAVLNGNTSALSILLENGCNPSPPKPKSNTSKRSTSGAIESPIEICERLYDVTCGVGKRMKGLLTMDIET